MPLNLEQYAEYLDTRDLPWPTPPEIDRPKAKAHLVRLPEIRVVIWNIYGTLLAISDGELYFEHPKKFIMDLALDKTLQEFKMWGSMSRKPGQPAEYLGQMYRKVLEDLRMAPSPGEKYPEIPVELIWEGILKKLFQKEYQFDVNFYGSLNEYSRKVAYFFHASLQGTACYKGADQAMQTVKQANLGQGLLGNGQVFTTVQLQRGLAQQDANMRLESLVDPEFCLLSHQVRSQKPSPRLFQNLLTSLEQKGIGPSQVLHVGNSIDKDIVPAKNAGMRTALVTLDKNTLQATKDNLKDAATRPDILMTELTQIAEILPES